MEPLVNISYLYTWNESNYHFQYDFKETNKSLEKKKNEVWNCGRNKSFLKKDTKTTCAHLLFKEMQLRCKAFSVIPHLGFGNIAKFGKSKSDYYSAFPTAMKGHWVGSWKQVGLSTLCSQFSLLCSNSLCSKNLTIMLKKFHYYAQNFFPGPLIFLPK